MEVSFIRKCGPEFVTGALRATSGKDMTTLKKPTLKTWRALLKTAGGVPHSPMRAVEYRFYVTNIPSFCATHFARHHVGVQPYIKSQRDDRNPNETIPRSQKPQGELISMMLDINVNSLIDMAKARLCLQASKETRQTMRLMKKALEQGDKYDKAVAEYLKAPCDWYDKCFEIGLCKKKLPDPKKKYDEELEEPNGVCNFNVPFEKW